MNNARPSKLVKRFRCRYPPEEKKMAAVIEAVKKRRLLELSSSAETNTSEVMSDADFEAKLKALEQQKVELEKKKSDLFQQLRSALTTSQTPASAQASQDGGEREQGRR